jgi:hypothetical protein
MLHFAIVFAMILFIGLTPGLPAEDVVETDYDESEILPYEDTPLFSIGVPPVATLTTQQVLSSLHPKSGAPFWFAAARVRDTNAHQSAAARVSVKLLCTLLC